MKRRLLSKAKLFTFVLIVSLAAAWQLFFKAFSGTGISAGSAANDVVLFIWAVSVLIIVTVFVLALNVISRFGDDK